MSMDQLLAAIQQQQAAATTGMTPAAAPHGAAATVSPQVAAATPAGMTPPAAPAAAPPAPPPVAAPPPGGGRSPYEGIDQVEVFEGNRRAYEHVGVFTGEIVEIRDGTTTRAPIRHYFATTLMVETSTNDGLQPGGLVDWFTMPSPQFPQYFAINIKKFLAAALGCEAAQVTMQVVEHVRGEQQPLRGRKIKWETYIDPKSQKARVRFYPLASPAAAGG